jgi:nucleoside-diphosphate-sugar epimerase
MKILITGGNGYIAKNLYSHLHPKYEITLVSRNEFDLTKREEVQHYFLDKYFDVVIHTAVKGGSRLNQLEESDVLFVNLLMYDNLMRCRDKFNKFIHFDSGAGDEANTPYGFSKHIINQLIKQDPKSINIKIYAVFDENELATRFIKSNILRYINKEDLNIHQDKQMDFFYMKDLVFMIEWLLNQHKEEFPMQEINCSYLEKYTLLQIAKLINSLDDYEVRILVGDVTEGKPYCGIPQIMPFNLIGLERGIKEVYNKLKK